MRWQICLSYIFLERRARWLSHEAELLAYFPRRQHVKEWRLFKIGGQGLPKSIIKDTQTSRVLEISNYDGVYFS